jgi:carbonic anhydrase/acetyltransferase-like protein (isoleucine patch superfamily)
MLQRFKGMQPYAHEQSFIAHNASIIGDVKIAEDVSIWFGAVLRGDINSINIGKGSNIQDNCVIHVGKDDNRTNIGEYVTVGHGAIVHGSTVGSHCLIGMGAILLDGAEIGSYTIIGAGSLVPQGKKIPSGVLCLGSPAKVMRFLTEEEKASLHESAQTYIDLYKGYISFEK